MARHQTCYFVARKLLRQTPAIETYQRSSKLQQFSFLLTIKGQGKRRVVKIDDVDIDIDIDNDVGVGVDATAAAAAAPDLGRTDRRSAAEEIVATIVFRF